MARVRRSYLLDVGLEDLQGLEPLLVVLGDRDRLDRLLQIDFLLFSERSGKIDNALHLLDVALHGLVQERLVGFRDLEEVHALVLVLGVLADHKFEVLIHHFRDEGHEGSHHDERLQQDVEEHVQGNVSGVVSLIALDSGSVQSHVPVGHLLDKVREFRNDGVQLVQRHLVSHLLDHVVRRSLKELSRGNSNK